MNSTGLKPLRKISALFLKEDASTAHLIKQHFEYSETVHVKTVKGMFTHILQSIKHQEVVGKNLCHSVYICVYAYYWSIR